MKKIKIFIILLFIFILNINHKLVAKEKDCFYCKKYEYLKDWPEEKRPSAFVYEKINYPKDMFIKNTLKNSRFIKKRASQKVSNRFIKSKSSLKKYQHLMIRDSAYFEAMFNESLNVSLTKVETLESLKKARDAIRRSLMISPNAKSSEAVYKFWATGKMMTQIYKKNKKNKKKKKSIESDVVSKRVKILKDLKEQIKITKTNAQRAATIEADKSINEQN